MMACLDILLNTHHCYLIETPAPATSPSSEAALDSVSVNQKISGKKYCYYVGMGNNANLIRSVFRKRLWWKEVDSIDKAQFVWTQLKNEAVIERCEKHETDWSDAVTLYEEEIFKPSPKRSEADP